MERDTKPVLMNTRLYLFGILFDEEYMKKMNILEESLAANCGKIDDLSKLEGSIFAKLLLLMSNEEVYVHNPPD